ncbi:hypothetical protein TUM3794_20170 [Shewanella colwelliana]|uniref:Uncharacterized protein n=1 Tax=Shewanella colwelliana TaxID=23 RepID=A0ABQ4P0E9_SHECO|nr:hypothetical protein [Shewanella colwelliana]GIU40959.1 hypothetical protein TUM3794_20170 [Shewanella colwelliana]
MFRLLVSALLLFAGGYANAVADVADNVYRYDGLSVELEQSVSESDAEFEARAKRVLMLKAIAMTPKFVSLQTHFDSRREELVEIGNVLQGAEVEINKLSITTSKNSNGAFKEVMADLIVDVSAMREKVEGKHKQKALQKRIENLRNNNSEMVGLLKAVQSNHELSELSLQDVQGYLSMLGVKLKVDVVNGAEIRAQANAVKHGLTKDQVLQKEIELAYRTFVYPFIEHVNVDYEITAVTPIDTDLHRLTIKLKIDRQPKANPAWFPKSAAMMELCSKYFHHCESLYAGGEKKGVGEYLEPRYCNNNLFAFLPYSSGLPPRFVTHRFEPECHLTIPNKLDLTKVFYKGYLTGTVLSTEMDAPYLKAFETLSLDAYWLSMRFGKALVRLNLSDVTIENMSFFLFVPKTVARSDLDVSIEVHREVYRVSDASWRGLNGERKRHQPRGIVFY